MEKRKCKICKQEKSLEEFESYISPKGERKRRWYGKICKECARKKSLELREKRMAETRKDILNLYLYVQFAKRKKENQSLFWDIA